MQKFHELKFVWFPEHYIGDNLAPRMVTASDDY